MDTSDVRIKRYKAQREKALDLIKRIEFERVNSPEVCREESIRTSLDKALSEHAAIVFALDILLRRISTERETRKTEFNKDYLRNLIKQAAGQFDELII